MTPEQFTPRFATFIALAIAALAALCWTIACTGSGHAAATIPTPGGPALVDLWWCEEGQCVVADYPENTPLGAKLLASGVELDPMYQIPKQDP
jgi:hypothetical protein